MPCAAINSPVKSAAVIRITAAGSVNMLKHSRHHAATANGGINKGATATAIISIRNIHANIGWESTLLSRF